MTPGVARKECKESLIGEGRLEAEIAFHDVPPLLVKASCSSSTAASKMGRGAFTCTQTKLKSAASRPCTVES